MAYKNIRENDRPSKELFAALCRSQCSVFWAVCSVCRSKVSLAHTIRELESQIVLLEEQACTVNIILEERGHFKHLQRESNTVKNG